MTAVLDLADLERCFGGAIPAVLSTVGADGAPNVTYLSRAHRVDDERIALSNQFFSKTARNIAVNPRACLLLMDPLTHDEFRLSLLYERTERRGPVFERLRADIDAFAKLTGLEDVFRLRAADVYRVVAIDRIPPNPAGVAEEVPPAAPTPAALVALAELVATLGRSADVDTMIDLALEGLAGRFGHQHCQLMLLDERGTHLYTVAARGLGDEAVGAEVELGHGLAGLAAARCAPLRTGNLHQLTKYARAVSEQVAPRRVGPGWTMPVATLPRAESRVAVPAVSCGELIGVLVVDAVRPMAFDDTDVAVLTVVATLLATAVRQHVPGDDDDDVAPPVPVAIESVGAPIAVRFFAADGSVFLGDDYLIKGVAGRLLRSLVREHLASGRTEFSNRELRLDPTLEMPGFKDNFESRLLLLKRRLDERQAPIRIERTARGRFRLDVGVTLHLTEIDAG